MVRDQALALHMALGMGLTGMDGYTGMPMAIPLAFFPGIGGGAGGAAAPAVPARIDNATTLRQKFNLHKGSLACKLVPGSDHLAGISFDFDAEMPCTINILFAVVEEPAPGPDAPPHVAHKSFFDRLQTKMPRRGPTYRLPAGKRQHFDQTTAAPVADPQAKQPNFELLDLRLYTASELTHVPRSMGGTASASSSSSSSSSCPALPGVGGMVPPQVASIPIPPIMAPLVVVIQEDGLADRAEVSAPRSMDGGGGAAVHSSDGPSQLQATYASFVLPQATPTGTAQQTPPSVAVRVLQQKIQVGAAIYVIKELFGMEQQNGASAAASHQQSSAAGHGGVEPGSYHEAGGAGTSPSRDDAAGNSGVISDPTVIQGSECVICLTEARDTAILPCRHMCLCNDCAHQLRLQTNRCPICRTPVSSLLHIDGKTATSGGTKAS